MSVPYKAVLWNRQKRLYDGAIAAGVLLSLGIFAAVAALDGATTLETLLLRSTAFTALLMLHLILCIGPLARLDRRFAPLLYNRRHLGVSMFGVALLHGSVALMQYHVGGSTNPLVTAFAAYGRDYAVWAAGGGIAHVPFEPFGIIALLILFFMAATSHDFWLRQLGAPVWKALHMGVYLAYGLVLVHVALGFLQAERGVLYPLLMLGGFCAVVGLHLLAGRQELFAARAMEGAAREGFLPACPTDALREGRAQVCTVVGERVAVWLHEGRVFATSNVCRHQGGPLGEGRIIDGCVTCPWHGWNYRIGTGTSPPPFDEQIPTYRVRVLEHCVFVHPQALSLGAASTGEACPTACTAAATAAAEADRHPTEGLPDGG